MVHKHLYFTNSESFSTITVRIITAIFFPAESQLDTYIKYMLGFLKNENFTSLSALVSGSVLISLVNELFNTSFAFLI